MLSPICVPTTQGKHKHLDFFPFFERLLDFFILLIIFRQAINLPRCSIWSNTSNTGWSTPIYFQWMYALWGKHCQCQIWIFLSKHRLSIAIFRRFRNWLQLFFLGIKVCRYGINLYTRHQISQVWHLYYNWEYRYVGTLFIILLPI